MYNVSMQKARYVAALGIPLLALLSFTLAPIVAFTWSGPPSSPPNGNVAPPINVGSVEQVKNGGLGVASLAVFGNSLFGGSTGSNAYMNFGNIPTPGDPSSGYGIRDNDGTLEFKSMGGDWQSIQNILYALCGGSCGVPSGAVMAFDLNSCPTGWSEYAPAKGRFIRGRCLTSSGCNDPDGVRTSGHTQNDEFKSHTHRIDPTYNVWILPDNNSGSATFPAGGNDYTQLITNTGSSGGSETRPKNVALLYCRKD